MLVSSLEKMMVTLSSSRSTWSLFTNGIQPKTAMERHIYGFQRTITDVDVLSYNWDDNIWLLDVIALVTYVTDTKLTEKRLSFAGKIDGSVVYVALWDMTGVASVIKHQGRKGIEKINLNDVNVFDTSLKLLNVYIAKDSVKYTYRAHPWHNCMKWKNATHLPRTLKYRLLYDVSMT